MIGSIIARPQKHLPICRATARLPSGFRFVSVKDEPRLRSGVDFGSGGQSMRRRFFLKLAAAAALIPAIVGVASAANASAEEETRAGSIKRGPIPRRPLGSTASEIPIVR